MRKYLNKDQEYRDKVNEVCNKYQIGEGYSMDVEVSSEFLDEKLFGKQVNYNQNKNKQEILISSNKNQKK